jgi:membrane-associated phospholipid phosphatase
MSDIQNTNEIINTLCKTTDTIGYFGPQILAVISIILLRTKFTLLKVYIIGYLLNTVLNAILKGIIREPRPSEDKNIFNIWLNNKSKTDRKWFDRYGMPSGHAQTAFYSTSFIFFALKNTNITILYLILTLNTLYQRVNYKNHTVNQVIIGSLVGSLVGYFFFNYSKMLLKGKLKLKPDDNAPI